MKVIQDNFQRRETCPHCASLLEFGYNDIIIETERRPGGKTRKYIVCPCCDTKMDIKPYSYNVDTTNKKEKKYDNSIVCPRCGENKTTLEYIKEGELKKGISSFDCDNTSIFSKFTHNTSYHCSTCNNWWDGPGIR